MPVGSERRQEPLHDVHEGAHAQVHFNGETNQVETRRPSQALDHHVFNFFLQLVISELRLHQREHRQWN